jgi:hypothetical protein
MRQDTVYRYRRSENSHHRLPQAAGLNGSYAQKRGGFSSLASSQQHPQTTDDAAIRRRF